METFNKLVLWALCLCTLFGCGKKDNAFNLDGDCNILSLTLDEKYPAAIDQIARTAVVQIPEIYDDTDMRLTALTLSEGATSSVPVGSHLNMVTPAMIRVTNGSVYREFTLSVKHDEARILSFLLNGRYIGIINETNHTITAQVPEGTSLKALVPTITTTEGATVTPLSGVACDFTEPVDFTVTCRTATYTYKVTVKEMVPPHVVYLGLAETMQQLNMEEQTACSWMLNHVEKSAYVSFADLAAGTVDMSQCKLIWWHLHKDGSINSKDAFATHATDAINALDKLREYYQNGGNFLLTRYATYLPAYLGEADCVPNNCWGGDEANAETVGGPWDFAITGHTDHALWQNLMMGSDPNKVLICDAGYRITNSTAQYHIGADWGGYPTRADFCTKTGAKDIAGGDDAVVAWEYMPTAEHGHIVCIGSGCYDWYSVAGDAGATTYHTNIAKITENAINYLK